jgi:hypothetical protein
MKTDSDELERSGKQPVESRRQIVSTLAVSQRKRG